MMIKRLQRFYFPAQGGEFPINVETNILMPFVYYERDVDSGVQTDNSNYQRPVVSFQPYTTSSLIRETFIMVSNPDLLANEQGILLILRQYMVKSTCTVLF